MWIYYCERQLNSQKTKKKQERGKGKRNRERKRKRYCDLTKYRTILTVDNKELKVTKLLRHINLSAAVFHPVVTEHNVRSKFSQVQRRPNTNHSFCSNDNTLDTDYQLYKKWFPPFLIESSWRRKYLPSTLGQEANRARNQVDIRFSENFLVYVCVHKNIYIFIENTWRQFKYDIFCSLLNLDHKKEVKKKENFLCLAALDFLCSASGSSSDQSRVPTIKEQAIIRQERKRIQTNTRVVSELILDLFSLCIHFCGLGSPVSASNVLSVFSFETRCISSEPLSSPPPSSFFSLLFFCCFPEYIWKIYEAVKREMENEYGRVLQKKCRHRANVLISKMYVIRRMKY